MWNEMYWISARSNRRQLFKSQPTDAMGYTLAIVFMEQIRWIFERCLPLTLDLLLNANECTQWRLHKCTVDPLKRETNGSGGRHMDGEVDGTKKQALLFMELFLIPICSLGLTWILTVDLLCGQSNRAFNIEGDTKHLILTRTGQNAVAVATWTQCKVIPCSQCYVETGNYNNVSPLCVLKASVWRMYWHLAADCDQLNNPHLTLSYQVCMVNILCSSKFVLCKHNYDYYDFLQIPVNLRSHLKDHFIVYKIFVS